MKYISRKCSHSTLQQRHVRRWNSEYVYVGKNSHRARCPSRRDICQVNEYMWEKMCTAPDDPPGGTTHHIAKSRYIYHKKKQSHSARCPSRRDIHHIAK